MREGFVSRPPFFNVLSKARSQQAAYLPVSVFESALRDKCNFKYHNKRLDFGTNKETAKAKSCQPWTKEQAGGFDLQSIMGGGTGA